MIEYIFSSSIQLYIEKKKKMKVVKELYIDKEKLLKNYTSILIDILNCKTNNTSFYSFELSLN